MRMIVWIAIALAIAAVTVSAFSFEDTEAAMMKWKAQVTALAPGENKLTLTRPEGERTYYIYVPKGYTAGKALPLLFAFHGLGDTCENFGDAVGFKSFADQYNFFYVYPCGWAGPIGNAWAAGTCCLSGAGIDDVQFTRDMISALDKLVTIDHRHIWTSGFSNGAMFSETLACQASDLFSAAVSVSGCTELIPGNDAGIAACDKSYAASNKTVSVLGVHGDGDMVVPWTGNALLGFPTQPTNFAAWAKRIGCSGTPSQTINKGTFTNQLYDKCTAGAQLELVKNSGGSHTWPQGGDFDTTTYIVQFLQRVQEKQNRQ